MTLAELLPAAKKLTVIEKLRLIRILAEEIDQLESTNPSELSNPAKPTHNHLRPFGLCAGEFVVPDDFDATLPEEILRAFEGR